MHPAIRIAFFFVLIYCIIYAASYRVLRTSCDFPYCRIPCGLWLGLPGRQSFGDAERHFKSARAIAHVGFNIAIHAEPDSLAAQLNARAKAHSALVGIGYSDTVDLVVGQLLQPVSVESEP